MIRVFRAVSIVEATTYLALLTAVVIYRVLDRPDFISFLGPVHGLIFFAYFVLVLRLREGQGWRLGRTLLVLLAAALPLGGFFVGNDLSDDRAG